MQQLVVGPNFNKLLFDSKMRSKELIIVDPDDEAQRERSIEKMHGIRSPSS